MSYPADVRRFRRNGVTAICDPRYRYGRPFSETGVGVAFWVLYGQVQAGASVAEISEWYEVSAAEVWEAIQWHTGIQNPRTLEAA